MKKSLCFYFQVHQPFRLSSTTLFEVDKENHLFEGPEGYSNLAVFDKVARKSYLPMTSLLLEMLELYPDFRVSFSLSGVFLEQCEQFGKIGELVLRNFKDLAQHPRVEILAETYYHSLSFLHSKAEFAEQVWLHNQKVYKLFGVKPRIFRNTELIYSDELAEFVRLLGFQGILAEGWDTVLSDDQPNHVRIAHPVKLSKEDLKIAKKYAPVNFWGMRKKPSESINVLTKNYKLSDDIAFRFGNKAWNEYPLTVEKYADWLDQTWGETINLFMDFETFGEHQWEDTGIFDFFRALPAELERRNIGFRTPSETIADFPARGTFSSPHYVSWADENRDISAWLENDLQKSAFSQVIEIEKVLYKYQNKRKQAIQELLHDFRRLQTSDHFYYMSTKYWADGDVHTYFSPYGSPYDAFINYMIILDVFKGRIKSLKL